MTSISAADSVAKDAPGKVHILAERNMRWYFGTQLISLTGLMLRQSVLSLLIIDLVGVERASVLTGFIWGLGVFPGIFLGVFAGMVVDRFDKRALLQVTAVLSIIQAGFLAYFAYTDVHHIPIWKIMTVMAFTGLTNTIDGIGRNAIVKDAVVNSYNVKIASVIFTSLYTLGMIIGNGLSGPLVLKIGYGSTFVLNGLSFVILIIGLRRLDFSHVRKIRLPWKGVWHSVTDNIVYASRHAGLRLCITLVALITVFGFSYNVILAIIAKVMFGGGPKAYSYLAAVAGIGSLVGSLLSIRYGVERPRGFAIVGCIVMGLAQIAFSRTRSIDVAACMVFFCGAGFMVAFNPLRGVIMHMVDPNRVGVVMGIMFMFFYLGMFLSAIGSGYVSRHYGPQSVLFTCGTCALVLGLVTPFLSGIKEIHK